MNYRVLSLIVLYVFAQPGFAQEHRVDMPRLTSLTADDAISALRSAIGVHGTSFQVLKQIQCTASTQDASRRSREAARLGHIALWRDGVFLDLLSTGGFLILESDPSTGMAVAIHLVANSVEGRTVINSQPVRGQVTTSVAAEIVSKTADFADMLLTTRSSNLRAIEKQFDGGRFVEYGRPAKESIFSISSDLIKSKADEDEYDNLMAVFGRYSLWQIRYAVSLPIFAANLPSALTEALDKQHVLTAQFLQNHGETFDFIYHLEDLSTIVGEADLRDRISWFKQIGDFLDQTLSSDIETSGFAANREISNLVLQIASLGDGSPNRFSVALPSSLVVNWKRTMTGEFVVTAVFPTEYDQPKQSEER
jgi:hypothetical protein